MTEKMSNPKPTLPHGWVVKQSKTYPDRVYYFNVHTGSSTWEAPSLLKPFINKEKPKESAPKNQNNNSASKSLDTKKTHGFPKQEYPPTVNSNFPDNQRQSEFLPEARFSPELSGSDGSSTPANNDWDLDLTSPEPQMLSVPPYPPVTSPDLQSISVPPYLPVQSPPTDLNFMQHPPFHAQRLRNPVSSGNTYQFGPRNPNLGTPFQVPPRNQIPFGCSDLPVYPHTYPESRLAAPFVPQVHNMNPPVNSFMPVYSPTQHTLPGVIQQPRLLNPGQGLGFETSLSSERKSGKSSIQDRIVKDAQSFDRTANTLVDVSSTKTTSTIRNFLGPKEKPSAPSINESSTIKTMSQSSNSLMHCSIAKTPLDSEVQKKQSQLKTNNQQFQSLKTMKRKINEDKEEDCKKMKDSEKKSSVLNSKKRKVEDSHSVKKPENKLERRVVTVDASSTAGSAGSDLDTRRIVHRRLSDELVNVPDSSHFQDPEKVQLIQSWIDQWEPNDPQLDSFSDNGGEQSSSTNRTSPDSVSLSISCYGDQDSRKIVMNNFPNKTIDSGIFSIGDQSGLALNNPWKDVHAFPAPVDHSRAVEESMEVEEVPENRDIEDMEVTDIVLKEVREHIHKFPDKVVGELTEKVSEESLTTPQESALQKTELKNSYRVHLHLASFEDTLWKDVEGVFESFTHQALKGQKAGDNLTQYTFVNFIKLADKEVQQQLLSQLAMGDISVEEFRKAVVRAVKTSTNDAVPLAKITTLQQTIEKTKKKLEEEKKENEELKQQVTKQEREIQALKNKEQQLIKLHVEQIEQLRKKGIQDKKCLQRLMLDKKKQDMLIESLREQTAYAEQAAARARARTQGSDDAVSSEPPKKKTSNMAVEEQLVEEVNDQETKKRKIQNLVVVIDTCVLISDLGFVEDLRDHDIEGFGKPLLMIPWVVMQELDALKDSKSRVNLSLSTEKKARMAVSYLNDNFQNKHQRVVGQTPVQAKEAGEAFAAQMNDDRIIQCCLQCQKKRMNSQVVLLTNDKNLVSKALISGVTAYSRIALLVGLRKLMKIPPSTSMCTTSVTDNSQKPKEAVVKPEDGPCKQTSLDEMFCRLKSLLKDALSFILEKEMKDMYKEIWLQVVLKKPPWTLSNVVESIRKHWMAVFGDKFQRRMNSNVESLWKVFRNGAGFSLTVESLCEVMSESLPLLECYHRQNKDDQVVAESLRTLKKLQSEAKQITKMEDNSHSIHKMPMPTRAAQPENSAQLTEKMAEKAHCKLRDICTCVESFINSVYEFLKGYNRARDLAQLHQLYALYEKMVPAVTDLRYSYSRSLEYSPEQVRKQAANVHDLCVQINGFFSRCNIQGNATQISTTEMQALFAANNKREVLKKVLPLLDKSIFKLHEIIGALPNR